MMRSWIKFDRYLRKGIEPRLKELNIVMNFIKEQIVEKAINRSYCEKSYNEKQSRSNDEFTGKTYIWRTENDSKVRSRHTERDGKTYIWGENLNSGEDYGCRCHAKFIDDQGNKIGLGRVKYEDGKPFSNELKDKGRG